MEYKLLIDRIKGLPLVICGPILRAVSEQSVTVWVALVKDLNVTLTIFLEKDRDLGILEEVSSSSAKTINVGKNLKLACITVKDFPEPLKPGELYYYNLFFEIDGETKSLKDEGIIDFDIFYEYKDSMGPDEIEAQINTPPKLPSFSLSPNDIDQLKIIHGSCRKPNAEGFDAMPTIDKIIGSDWTRPNSRPHFLFLTGDQVYADDVSPILLYMLMDASKTLLANNKEEFPSMNETVKEKEEKEEKIKIKKSDKDRKYISLVNGKPTWNGEEPAPHLRGRTVFHFAGFSEKFKNHLMTFGEYCAMYLFAWSDVLWDKELPEIEEVFKEYFLAAASDNTDPRPTNLDETYKKDHKRLIKFKSTLPKVRRALANVPTYMIFDDHEITDDWNMTKPWCDGVYSNKLGNRIIHNGLLAYSLFQAWGNTPEQFEVSKPGEKILKIISKPWLEGYFDADLKDIAGPLGLPIPGENIFPATKKDHVILRSVVDESQIIKWHYHIKIKQKNSNGNEANLFEIIVLDGRTKRSYFNTTNSKAKEYWHATLINDAHQAKQIPDDHDPFPLTIIVSPTSIINIPAVDFNEFTYLSEFMAYCFNNKAEKYNLDIYDHWKNQSQDFEKLLVRIAERGTDSNTKIKTRNVILTGDVHFAAASSLEYEKKVSNNNIQETILQGVFAQLVSSSFKKEEYKTRVVHYNGYKFSAVGGLTFKYPNFFGYGGLIFLFSPLINMIDRLINLTNTNESFYLFDPKLPKPKLFFGWEDPETFFGDLEQLKIKSSNILMRLVEIITKENPVLENDPVFKTLFKNIKPYFTKIEIRKNMMMSKDQTLNVVDDVTFPEPDWRYRIDYILAENDVRKGYITNELLDVGNPDPPDKNKALKEFLKASKNHSDFTHKYGSGKEIVGLNNVSEVTFKWKEEEKSVIQQTWWNLKSKDEIEEFFPLTKYIVPLDFKEDDLPKIKD